MNPTLIGIIGILIMLAIFMTRMPVAYVMAMVGYVGFSIMIFGKGGSTCSRAISTKRSPPTG